MDSRRSSTQPPGAARIAIALGDVTGIGPEVTLKAVAAELDRDSLNYVLLGDLEFVRGLNDRLGLRLDFGPYTGAQTRERVSVFSPPEVPQLPMALPPGAPEAARAAVAYLKHGAEFCLRGEASALVTAPVSKEAIIRSGQPFIGQTEFLSELAGAQRTVMMLLGPDDRQRWLRVALDRKSVV